MSETISTKPYLIRALYEWCSDNGFTPHIAVKVQGQVRVPMEYVRNGDIVLNISFTATSGLQMDNQAISFKGRFGGVSRDIYIPIGAVAAIFASENNQGMSFEVTEVAPDNNDAVRAPVNEKPAISLAVINTNNTDSADSTNGNANADAEPNTNANPEAASAQKEIISKENRKKPSFTVIK